MLDEQSSFYHHKTASELFCFFLAGEDHLSIYLSISRQEVWRCPTIIHLYLTIFNAFKVADSSTFVFTWRNVRQICIWGQHRMESFLLQWRWHTISHPHYYYYHYLVLVCLRCRLAIVAIRLWCLWQWTRCPCTGRWRPRKPLAGFYDNGHQLWRNLVLIKFRNNATTAKCFTWKS